jgi:hypothetical protein
VPAHPPSPLRVIVPALEMLRQQLESWGGRLWAAVLQPTD